jgi:hypothetical protein
MDKKKETSPLWKHVTIHHNETAVPFEMEVTGLHKSAMERLNDEIVRIKTSNSNIILNSKNDWAQPALVRIVPVTGNRLETQVGDTEPSRQARRMQDTGTQGGGAATPRRRRRRADLDPAPTPPGSSQRTSQRDTAAGQAAREERRERRQRS